MPTDPQKPTSPLLSAPKVSLPTGGGAIRGIGESFQANPVTGTGSFSVPIAVSPGRAGFQPSLALSYDSGAGNGPFGLGWRLDAPSIQRKTDRGLPQYQDAVDSDTFTLSGAEDLLPAKVQSGDAWVDDVRDEGPYRVRRYRPRTEGSWARIERWTRREDGDIHWRVWSKDNTTQVFGRSTSARLADPDDARRVFAWYLEEVQDERGNIARYDYQPEDRARVDTGLPYERGRTLAGHGCAYTYLKRVQYVNRLPGVAAAFQVQVVFDYGDHDDAFPTPFPDRPWPERQDPFSSFRSGFDVRCARLCRRVMVFHSFAELGPIPLLVRSTELSHQSDTRLTTLTAVRSVGYRVDGGVRTDEALPPIGFTYSRAELGGTVQLVQGLEDLPAGVDVRAYQWVDLDGEGAPGLLAEVGGAWWYKRNEGKARFGAPERLPERPSVGGLGQSQLVSLEGDGRLDLLTLRPGASGYQTRTADGGWEPFRPFQTLPNVDWADPNLRQLDLDGDGHPDLLITEDDALRWYPSEARDGYGESRRVARSRDEASGPTLVFASERESLFLADMTGDGLTDLVRIRNGQVCYWPNRGYGRFGARVVMAGAPVFDAPDQFDPGRIRLFDIDGSGPTDLVYLGREGVQIWSNHAGNRFGDGSTVAGFGGIDDAATVSVADLLGEGTACLVWSSRLLGQSWAPLRYLPLHASGKPHLLTTITNNLGGETKLFYASSTRYYLEDKRAGTPWATRLPFPVQVLERVEQRDHLRGWKFVQRYAYHHGYFDARDREFRGFGLVEQRDAESFSDFVDADTTNADLAFHKDPVLTRSWFHTGAWRDGRTLTAAYRREWYAGDASAPALLNPALPAGLSVEEEQEAVRALRGQLLRQEVYAEDGSDDEAHPYTVTEHAYAVRQVQPPDDEGHGVFLVVPTETRTSHYERDPADPRVAHSLVLEVDDYGVPIRTASVGYPRRAPEHAEQGTTAIAITESTLIHQDDRTDTYHLGVPARAQTWELSGLSGDDTAPFTVDALNAAFEAAAEIPYEDSPDGVSVQRRCLSHSRVRYWRDDLSGPLPLGELGLRALPYQNEALVFTPNLLSAAGLTSVTVPMLVNEGGYSRDAEGWWAPSGVQTLDPAGFYQPTALTDPWGNSTTVVYDSYALFVRSVTDPLGNTSSGDIDYQALQPYRTTDPNGDGSVVVLDALGRVTAVSVFGNAGEGDSTSDPTGRFVYYPNRWLTDRQPCAVYTAARERHADATTAWQEAWLYVDGHGNELMRKVPAAAGLAPSRDADGKLVYDSAGALVWKRCDPRWVGNGRTIVDNKGNPVRQYEPFFAPNEDYESDAEIVEWGVTPSLSYDPLGRNVRVDLPNGTFRTVTFDPWRQSTADENDNVIESDWYAARKDLPPANPEARAAKLTADHANTPTVTHLDALGRPFLTVQDNGASGLYETRVTLDIQGQARAVTDARGITTQTQRFDLLGRVVHEGSPDAGDTYALADLAGNPIHIWKSGDLHHWRQYDALRRPTHLIIEQSGTSTVAERLIYGEWHPDPAPLHLRGRLYRHYDGAGSSTVDSYDFKGNSLQTRRVLAASLPVDWTALDGAIDLSGLETLAKPLLERTGYKTSQTFDALNRPITQTTPDASVTTFGYDAGGRMTDLSAALRGASAYTLFVNEIQYNAKGQRTKITYGNGVVTRYTYDDDTFRLSRLTSVRRSDAVKIQDLVYTYDPVGNITEILDRAQDTLYFNNAQVSPRAWYTYDALYRLVTSRGRERASLGMTSSADPTMGVMPDARTAVWGYRQLYTYDAVGNIKEMRHRTDDPSGNWTRRYTYATDSNRLLKTTEASGTVRYTHNVRGAMVNLPHLHQDGLGSDNVTVDHNDQMIGAQLNTSDTAEYAYDGAGQRVFKRVTKGANVETRVYIGAYELWTREVRGATREQRETLHGMDGQQRVVMVETKTVSDGSAVTTPESRQRYQLGNHLGSASVELDQDGALIGYEEYHPYGTTSWQAFDSSAEVSAKRYKYTGMERDDETGLQCHGVRYYAGWLGRWVSADPLRIADGINRYCYVGGRPTSLGDPSGEAGEGGEKVYMAPGGRGDADGVDEFTPAEKVVELAAASGWYLPEGEVPRWDADGKFWDANWYSIKNSTEQETSSSEFSYGLTAGPGLAVTYSVYERASYLKQIEANSTKGVAAVQKAKAVNDLEAAIAEARKTSAMRQELRTATQKRLLPGSKLMSEAIEQPRNFDTLVDEVVRDKGFAKDSFDTYEEVAKKAGRSNQGVKSATKAGKVLGPVGAAAGYGLSLYNVYRAAPEDRLKVAVGEVGGTEGGLIGFEIGMYIGVQIALVVAGAFGFTATATATAVLVSGIVFGLALGYVGGLVGRSVMEALYDADRRTSI